ncbi:MAG: transposase family protein [Acidobacteria bacterium]|nr:transposase family protein [Acidobacteriota bacterium]
MKELVEILTEVEDIRKARGKKYELVAVLAMAIVAIMCGCKSYSAIAEWGRNYRGEITKALGFRRKKTPCKATLYRIFKNIKVEEVEEKIDIENTVITMDALNTQKQTVALHLIGAG